MTDVKLYCMEGIPEETLTLLRATASSVAADVARILNVTTNIYLIKGVECLTPPEPGHKPKEAYATLGRTDEDGEAFKLGDIRKAAQVVFAWLDSIISKQFDCPVWAIAYEKTVFIQRPKEEAEEE